MQSWREGIELYKFMGPDGRDGVARLFALSARAAWWDGQAAEGLRICQEGLETLGEGHESIEVTRLLHEAGRAYFYNAMDEDASRLCQRALKMSGDLGAVDVQADVLATLGVMGIPEGIEVCSRAIQISEANGFFDISTRARIHLGVLIRSRFGDTKTALKHTDCSRSRSKIGRYEGGGFCPGNCDRLTM